MAGGTRRQLRWVGWSTLLAAGDRLPGKALGDFQAEFGDEGEGVARKAAADAGGLFGLVAVGGEFFGNAVAEKEKFGG